MGRDDRSFSSPGPLSAPVSDTLVPATGGVWHAAGDSSALLQRVARECQLLAGAALDLLPAPLLERARACILTLPDRLDPRAQALVMLVMSKTLARVARAAGVAEDPDVVRCLLRITEGSLSPAWKGHLSGFIDCAERAVPRHAILDDRPVPPIVRAALEVIDQRHGDHDLDLRRVAALVRSSQAYLTRQLKAHTQHGFADHLRQRRMAAACVLMTDAALSLKEIASASGYRNVRRFERDARRVYGQSASERRETVSRPARKY